MYRIEVTDLFRGVVHRVISYSMPTIQEAKRSGHKYDGFQVIITGPRGGRWKLYRDERSRRAKYNWRKLRPQH